MFNGACSAIGSTLRSGIRRRQVTAHVHVELFAIGPLRQVAIFAEIGGVTVLAEGDDVEQALALRRMGFGLAPHTRSHVRLKYSIPGHQISR